MDDLTGRKFGAYHFIEELGQGGMATVYKAYQPGIDRHVAVKVLSRQFISEPQFVARFEQEAKVVAKLQHPHVLPLYDYGEAHGYAYIVMPLIAGGDLADLMSSKQLTMPEISRIVSQVGDALDYAHGQGVIHRDIKPTNILLDPRGNALLADFGLARMVEESSARLTASGHVVGTPYYMSPEQGMGKKLDGRTDIYALGVILHEMVTGQVPYTADTPIGVIFQHINEPLPRPSLLNENLPEPMEQVILKAMAKQPEDRFSSGAEMVAALQKAIGTNPSLAAINPTPAHQPAGTIESSRLMSLPPAKIMTPAPASTAEPSKPAPLAKEKAQPAGSNLMMIILLAVIGILLVIILGLVIFFGFQAISENEDHLPTAVPVPTETAPPAQLPELELPEPTETTPPTPVPTSLPQPTDTPPQPTEPPSQPENTPLPAPLPQPQPEQEQPQSSGEAPPGPGNPPQEAIDVCRGLAEGTACQVQSPRGLLSGTCRQIPQGPIACVPDER